MIQPIVRDAQKPTITVFTGGCKLCSGALMDSLKVAEDLGFNLQEDKIDGEEATRLGLRAAPTIVCDGKVLFEYKPSEEELRAKLEELNTAP